MSYNTVILLFELTFCGPWLIFGRPWLIFWRIGPWLARKRAVGWGNRHLSPKKIKSVMTHSSVWRHSLSHIWNALSAEVTGTWVQGKGREKVPWLVQLCRDSLIGAVTISYTMHAYANHMWMSRINHIWVWIACEFHIWITYESHMKMNHIWSWHMNHIRMHCVTYQRGICEERWGAGVEYHFQEI